MAGKKDIIKDSDRYSILVPNLGHCFLCGADERICLHEVFHGTANRKKSKEDGMILPLCFEHHQGTFGVHNNKSLDDHIKAQAQKIWIEHYSNSESGIEDFINRYGKNFID